MTDYRDPAHRDPNDPRWNDPRSNNSNDLDRPWSNATWGWIAGIAVAALVVLLVLGRSVDTTQTASRTDVTAPTSTPPPPAMLPAPGVPAPTPTPPAPAR